MLFNYYGVSVWEDEKVLEIVGADGYTTMSMYLIVNFKMAKVVNFMLCIFYHH